MYMNADKWRLALLENKIKYVDGCYKIDEDYEADFIEKLWPKRNPYLDYCNNDVKLTKEMTNNMGKIKRVNDPRMNYNTGNIYVVINGKAYIPETMEVRNGFREQMEFGFTVTADPRYAAMNTMLAIKDVIHNPPATIVFWGDGSKTVVKCQDGEEYDPEKGLTMAFFKRMHDNKGRYFEEIKKWNNKYVMSQFKDEVHTITDEKVIGAIEAGMSKKISDTSKLIAEMEQYRAEHSKLVTIRDYDELPKVENNEKLKELVERELNTSKDESPRWVLFYAPADRVEDEGYTKHPVVYKHKASAVRAAKRLISRLPAGVDYHWFVDFIDHVEEW